MFATTIVLDEILRGRKSKIMYDQLKLLIYKCIIHLPNKQKKMNKKEAPQNHKPIGLFVLLFC